MCNLNNLVKGFIIKRITKLTIFIVSLLLSFTTTANDELYEQIMAVRAQSYSASDVSRELLDDINTNANLDLRGELVGEGPNPTGRAINGDWISNARQYMNQINNRAYMTDAGAGEFSGTQQRAPQNLPEVSSREPKLPNEDAFNNEMKELEGQKKTKTMVHTSEFRQNHLASLEGFATPENRAKFEKAGLQKLYYKIEDFVMDGGNHLQSKKLIRELVASKDLLTTLDAGQLKAQGIDLDPIKRLIPDAEKKQFQIKEEIQKIDREKAYKKSGFEQAKAEHPERLRKYKEEVAKVEKERAKIQAESSAQNSSRSGAQTDLDRKFFTDKNLNPITDLSQITKDERMSLLSRKDNPLGARDPSQALDIVNGNRKKQRDFIQRVRNVSNEVASAAQQGRAPQSSGLLQNRANELTRQAQAKNLAGKYRDSVNSRLSNPSLSNNLDARHVSNPRSRLALLDSVTNGSINPSEKFGPGTDPKSINIEETLKKIPSNDIQGRKAFAKYVLENGTPEQIRSIKIQDFSTTSMVEAEGKFKAGCRKPPVSRGGW